MTLFQDPIFKQITYCFLVFSHLISMPSSNSLSILSALAVLFLGLLLVLVAGVTIPRPRALPPVIIIAEGAVITRARALPPLPLLETLSLLPLSLPCPCIAATTLLVTLSRFSSLSSSLLSLSALLIVSAAFLFFLVILLAFCRLVIVPRLFYL
jgi:hypothetical protein